RSSALASKATGFPIAKIAAKLAIGYTLDELQNDITRVTPASFEPALDYVVVKIPRFTFEKFAGTEPLLTTSMKSVGEAMAIGRSFPEAYQKALRSLETGLDGLDEIEIEGAPSKDAVIKALSKPMPDRGLTIAQAFRHGLSEEDAARACSYDPWFLGQIKMLVDTEEKIRAQGLPQTEIGMARLKRLGFSDARLGTLVGKTAADVMAHRHALGVRPVYKRIDTSAAEFPSATSYLYSCYEDPTSGPVENEAEPTEATKIMILGGGPNRIGQGIEFDYCCVHAAYALSEAGYETIMVNCNPETVSTDYDTSDRLYFEPLTVEDVLEIATVEMSKGTLLGVIVQFGGQTPLKLAASLEAYGIPILGTSPDAIDLAEDRQRFQQLLHDLDLKQPPNGTATNEEEALEIAERIGYPVLLRPSYVLGGRAMEIVHDKDDLRRYMRTAVKASGANPVLVDRYLANAIEVDIDALGDGETVRIAGVMEHIEEAGVHSGDSACALPPHSLEPATIKEIGRQVIAMGEALNVKGLMNAQFAVKPGEHEDEIYILEVNPRASRTVPFVAKATGVQVAKLAARAMAGEKLDDLPPLNPEPDQVAVKEAVFPFARFPGVDILLGPEMKSTGEAMGLDQDFGRAFAKAQIGAGVLLPLEGTVFISVRDNDKPLLTAAARRVVEMGFDILATGGTADFLISHGVPAKRINKVLEGRPHVVDAIKSGQVQLVFNTSEGPEAIQDSFSLRRAALLERIPYYTTAAGSIAAIQAISALRDGALEVKPLQSYFT
ncbi:MAG: carbamoyl-phosphate synthase large subunit, partial [Alphaproteobacteria bacterium]